MSTYLTPYVIAAMTAASSVLTTQPVAVAPVAPWYTPLMGPFLTLLSAGVSFVVSQQVLKVRLKHTEHRLDRMEIKIDRIADIAERLARIEGQIATR